MVIAYFDGDDIGPRLELMLLDERLEDARQYSRSVTRALTDLRAALEHHPDVDILVAGGDDVVASWPNGAIDANEIERIRSIFCSTCGQTVSAGIGLSASEAAGNLRRAKLLGKNRVVFTD